ncbi:hypothetical protein FUSO8_12810 [Fusobacterium necrophorum DJ-2]|uniref:Uncharacterized protein n=1 Tax=Fusobacterium necrophorum DJ-2 TaxID=1441737 RepID=A0AB73BZE1_9FUSO|nr:hypothetical protein FUSO8_12810 [Fusobacterium necrophorum DJ-2]
MERVGCERESQEKELDFIRNPALFFSWGYGNWGI